MFDRPLGDPPSNGGPGGRASLGPSGPRGGALVRTLLAAAFLSAAAFSPSAATPAPTNEDCQTCHGGRRGQGRRRPERFRGGEEVRRLRPRPGRDLLRRLPRRPREDLGLPAQGASEARRLRRLPRRGRRVPRLPSRNRRAAAGQGKPEASCASCHGGHDVVAVKNAAFRFAPARQTEACGILPPGEVKTRFLASDHGKAVARRAPGPDLPRLPPHPVTAGSAAETAALKLAQERLCLSCHLRDKSVRETPPPRPSFIASYEHSVHGAALAARRSSGAAPASTATAPMTCRHGFDSASPVNKMRVQQVCARCHEAESREYDASVHGAAIRQGKRGRPGLHRLPRRARHPFAEGPAVARRGRQRVGPGLLAVPHLGEGHGKVGPSAATGSQTFRRQLPRPRRPRRRVEVANCASCHGTHDILPSSDPASRISPANLAQTCGIGLPSRGQRAVRRRARSTSSRPRGEEPLLYWIATLYLILIVVVVGGMLVHNLLDFVRKSKRHMQIRRGELVEPPAGRGLYLRMTLGERLQHGGPHGQLHPARRDRLHAPLPRGVVGPLPAPILARAAFDVREPRSPDRRRSSWWPRASTTSPTSR